MSHNNHVYTSQCIDTKACGTKKKEATPFGYSQVAFGALCPE